MVSIYWINLMYRDDRRKHMYYELESLYNIRITPDTNISPELSCCKSHYDAILTAWYDNVDYAIIVEDDIFNFKEMINLNFFKSLFKLDNWEIIQLHYISPEFLNALQKLHCGHSLVKGYLMSTACYLINKKGIYNFLYKMSNDNFKNWLKFTKNNPDILKLDKSEQKKHPLWSKPSIGVTFLGNARAEEFVFRYVNTYFSLYPLINTIEKNTSDIQVSNDLIYNNMLLINNIFKTIDIKSLPIENKRLELPYDSHWFKTIDEAYEQLVANFK